MNRTTSKLLILLTTAVKTKRTPTATLKLPAL